MEINVLESWLYQAANILRGPVDQSDFKAYIFPLLFFKRISDVYDEEYKNAIEEFGEDIDYLHRFIIPEGCHWNDIRETSENIGAKIHECIRAIEKENPEKLSGIFGDTQWSNKEKLSDEILKDLVEHFSQHSLNNNEVKSNTMGLAYEYLIKKFADDSNKSAGEFYTPREVVKLMTMILDPQEGDSIYDPTCGTGGMLLEAYEYVTNQGKQGETLKLYGQEKNLTTSGIARINMFLHDIEDFYILRGDTLREPQFHENDKLQTFDCVIANPPFSLKNWGVEEWKNDPYGRNSFGIPPEKYGDYAWVEHMIKSSNSKGKIVVVLPQGALFRKGKEGEIRKQIILEDMVECVIYLGKNLFYGTTIPASILVLNKNKDDFKKGKIQFINVSDIYTKDKNQNYLNENAIEKIYSIYSQCENIEGRHQIVELEKIKDKNYTLNVEHYVQLKNEDEEITLNTAYSEMISILNDSKEKDEILENLLKEMRII